MHRWTLREFMARHKIKNRDLAKALGRPEESISRIKKPDKMPQMNGAKFDELCKGLTLLTHDGYVVTHTDLLEYVAD